MTHPSTSRLPLSVWSLALAMGVGMSGATIAVRVGAEFGNILSGSAALATYPTGLQVVGVMLGGLLFSRAMAHYGRKPILLVGLAFGVLAGLIGVLASVFQHYWILFPAHLCLGLYLSCIALLRFTAADQVAGALSARAISLTLFGGVLAAFVGPGFVFAANLIDPAQYYGISYGFIGLVALAVCLLIAATPIKNSANAAAASAPPTGAPPPPYMSYAYGVGVLTGAIGYAVMALLMTAAALHMQAMNMGGSAHAGHFGPNVRTFAIMWHVVAMFAPMVILPRLAHLMGLKNLMLLGAGLLITACLVGLLPASPTQMFVALIVLGFGWAATYGAGGIVVKQVVPDAARFLAQGRNEFTVSFFTGLGTIGAGPALAFLGWEVMNWMALVLVAILVPLLLRLSLTKTT